MALPPFECDCDFLRAIVLIKSSLVQPYTKAFKNPCRGAVKDYSMSEMKGNRWYLSH